MTTTGDTPKVGASNRAAKPRNRASVACTQCRIRRTKVTAFSLVVLVTKEKPATDIIHSVLLAKARQNVVNAAETRQSAYFV
jgi:hypothetical protein